MQKILYFLKKINFYLFFLVFLVIIFSFLFNFIFLKHQKMPLTSSMTFSSPDIKNIDEINIYVNAKTSDLYYDNETISYNEHDKKTSQKFNTLPISIYFIILGCSLPIIIFLMILLIPTNKIIDNLFAYNFNKKKKEKIKLGVQTKKSHFDIDDDNL